MCAPAPPRISLWLGRHATAHASRSASGQCSIGSERTRRRLGIEIMILTPPAPSSVLLEPDLPANDLAELLIGLGGLQPNIEVDRGLDVAVTEQALNDLIGAGIMTQIDCRGRMTELMNGEPQARHVFNPVRDLTAEHARCFRLPAHPRKQIIGVRPPHQLRTELMNV